MRKLHDQPACRGNGPALPSDVGGHHGRLAARSSQLGRSLPPTPDILRRRSEPTRWAHIRTSRVADIFPNAASALWPLA